MTARTDTNTGKIYAGMIVNGIEIYIRMEPRNGTNYIVCDRGILAAEAFTTDEAARYLAIAIANIAKRGFHAMPIAVKCDCLDMLTTEMRFSMGMPDGPGR